MDREEFTDEQAGSPSGAGTAGTEEDQAREQAREEARAAARALAEEAARLVASLRESVAAAHREAEAGSDRGTTAFDTPSCRVCPICQVLDAVRGTRPELAAGVGSIVTQLAEAVRTVLNAMPQPAGGSAGAQPDSDRDPDQMPAGGPAGPVEPPASPVGGSGPTHRPEGGSDLPVAERIEIT